MLSNEVIETMMNRKSIRSYTDEMPSDEIIETIVRAGQQAPFASQLCSLLLTRDPENNTFHSPLEFIILVDSHRWEKIMKVRGWEMDADDMLLLVLGMQDASYMAENMVIAAESLGLGSCFLGGIPFHSRKIIERFKLPQRVFPMVGLTMGYPARNPPVRPRYPLSFTLFEGEYPEFTEEQVNEAIQIMDEGYLAQDYYRGFKAKIPLHGGREETFTYENYSWTEHISRKWGQQLFPTTLWKHIKRCGFNICPPPDENEA